MIQKPTSANLDNDSTFFPPEKRNIIKNQPFVKFDRIKDVLESSQQLCVEAIPELREYLKVRLLLLLLVAIKQHIAKFFNIHNLSILFYDYNSYMLKISLHEMSY